MFFCEPSVSVETMVKNERRAILNSNYMWQDLLTNYRPSEPENMEATTTAPAIDMYAEVYLAEIVAQSLLS